MPHPTETSLEKILASVVNGYDPAQVDLDTPLKTMPGWDSLARLNFIVECEEVYDLDLHASELAECATLRELLQLLEKRAG